MKHLVFIIITILSIPSYGQVKVFDNYDFKEGNFSLIFLNVEPVDEDEIEVVAVGPRENFAKSEPAEFVDSRKHYIIDSRRDLNKIKKSWTAKPVDYMYMCWYNYFIYLLRDGEVVSEMRANFECKELLIDGIPFEFDSTLITAALPQAQRVYKIEMTFDSIENGRELYSRAKSQPGQLMINFYRPVWVAYDGQFRVEYLDYEKPGSATEKISKIIKQSGLREFQLAWAGSSMGRENEPNDHSYKVYCNMQPERLEGLTVEEDWHPFEGPYKATFLTRDASNIH